jgi:Fe-S-cluster containining protein
MNNLTIGKYIIDPVLFEKGFSKGCGPYQCETTCCSSGVFLDPKDRDVIIAHTDEVKKQMDETQTTNDAIWFDNRHEVDADFPSGYAVGTEVFNNKCVFLRKDGRCSVQLVSVEKYNDPWKIKPFYCVAFPIAVDGGVLTYDDYQDGKTQCCSIVRDTDVTLVDSCKAELEYVLGKDGYKELQDYKIIKLQNSK